MKTYLTVTKALADETRIRIIKLLEHHELCVCQIQAIIGLGQSTISKHLSILKNAGLVEIRKEGIWIYHRLARNAEDRYVFDMLKLIKGMLNEEALIEADREKAVEYKQIELEEICSK